MKKFESLIENLRWVDERRDENYVKDFERILSELHEIKSSIVLSSLIDFFDDSAPFDEPMFSIIHLIEIFEDQTYVRALLDKSVGFCDFAPRWASIVFMRVINSEPTRHELVRQLRDSNDTTKNAIKNLMEKINSRNIGFVAKTTSIIVAATSI